jgi:hypothetical protein
MKKILPTKTKPVIKNQFFVNHEQLFYSSDTGFGFVSDDNLVFCPEKTLTAVIAHIHYFPDAWKGQAHTTKV